MLIDETNLSNVIVNYNDYDPISLELIKDLPKSKLFFVTNKLNNKKYAYDAINWFIHISNDRRHPVTREKLSNSELWDLYLTTIKEFDNILDIDLLQLLQKSLQNYHSGKIKIINEGKKAKIVPVSPLFLINILQFSLLEKSDVSNTKTYNLVYQLKDARDSITIVCKKKEATIEIPMNMCLTIGK